MVGEGQGCTHPWEGAYGANDVAYVRANRGGVSKRAVCRNILDGEIALARECRVVGGLRGGSRPPAPLVCAVAADPDDRARSRAGRGLYCDRKYQGRVQQDARREYPKISNHEAE